MKKLTPMMQQYMEIKNENKDCILFFRLGDFYEMFFEDAIVASRVLEIALTGKNCGLEEKAPMCGVPFHSSESYISRLVEAGYKVAIGEQVEDPAQAKGLVKRAVVRIITPGTVVEESLLDNKKNNYLMSIYKYDDQTGLAYVDISTGELFASQIPEKNLLEEISKISPREIIFDGVSLGEKIEKICKMMNIYLNEDAHRFYQNEESLLEKHFDRDYIIKSGLENNKILRKSLEGLLNYVLVTQRQENTNINSIKVIDFNEQMVMDISTRRNLELTETMRNRSKKGSLLHVLDKTKTAMGGRMLRKWVEEPLVKMEDIENRLFLVDELYSDYSLREDLIHVLNKIYDIERLCGKVAFEKINPKELINLKDSLGVLPELKKLLIDSDLKKFSKIGAEIDEMKDVYGLIDESILEEPSINIKDGNLIKEEYDERVKELRHITKNGTKIVRDIESREKEKHGIKSLKIGFNKVFGYYIEITNSNLKDFDLPQDYVRKQTLSNAERFITEELKEIEEKILNSNEKIKEIEYAIFNEIRLEIYKNIKRLQGVSKVISTIDAILSLSIVAFENNYCRPKINELGELKIVSGRHPVVERLIDEESFIPNDTRLDIEKSRIGIITGPNMAGKSTYMRQVAVITLMAHMGSFVPAEEADISVVDRIFTRVGASDDLSQGESTFMVEMNEVSNILANATGDSLIILDEVGRGTSTFDGLSIAWSIVEYINNNIKAKTLFATHYHELSELEQKFHGIKNYSISVKEDGSDIIFLRKIVSGSADRSYGIHVAGLADIPDAVLDRAKEILCELEENDITKKDESSFEDKCKKCKEKLAERSEPEKEEKKEVVVMEDEVQISFEEKIEDRNGKELIDEIKNLEIINMTPMEGLNKLYELQRKLKMK